MVTRIALAGNPNTGKTSLFNALTGSSQRVGNWPGVTVEKKEGQLKGTSDVQIEDLPGIYSLSPYTAEERVARDYLIQEHPDVIIDIIDATNLERNLYLTMQLLETGIPMVVALNMIDVVEKNGDKVDIDLLQERLACPVVGISALKGQSIDHLIQAAIKTSQEAPEAAFPTYESYIHEAIFKIKEKLPESVEDYRRHWTSVQLFERDEDMWKQVHLSDDKKAVIEGLIEACEEKGDDDSEGLMSATRYDYIAKIIQGVYHTADEEKQSLTDRIDAIVTNRFLALPIFALVMYLVYFIAVSTIGKQGTDWVNDVVFGEVVPKYLGGYLDSLHLMPWLNGLIMDGLVAGVGAVIGFLPQMLVLFACLAFLEECGYMARIAFVLDRIFRKFGLSGKSFIPILVSTGCGVPGIMAARTIENDNDRRLTILTATFIPCNAKLPIIALIAGAFFPHQSWVAPSTYFLGMGAIIVSGIMLKKTRWFSGNPAPFVIELPAYHLPSFTGILRTMFERGKAFVKKAGTLVLLATVIVWFLQGFNWHLQMVEEPNHSILATLGRIVSPIFAPLGWPDWRAAVASVTGLLAKENLVGTFGVLFGFAEAAEDGSDFWPQLAHAFNPLAGYSLMAFNLLCVPCFAAVGALRREMMDDKLTLFAVVYQCVLAYCVSLIIYQLGMWYAEGQFGFWTLVALFILAGFIYMLFIKKPYKAPKKTYDYRPEPSK